MFLGKIVFLDDERGMLAEERTEENRKKTDEDLKFVFSPDEVAFLSDRNDIKKGDIVWFRLRKPCGGKEMVDSIKKPIFPRP
ncbi:MAG: hypothetical protein WC878_06275 [Candidatus Paceibacterota bacterium]